MLRKFMFILCVLGLMAMNSTAYAYVYSFSLNGMPTPSTFESFQMNFQVAGDFGYVSDSLVFGSAVPAGTGAVATASETPIPEVIADWAFVENNPTVVGNIFEVAGYNGDVLDLAPSAFSAAGMWFHTADGLYTENNLMNGVLFTFEYTGTIDDFTFKMGDWEGTETGLDGLLGLGISIVADDGKNIVPIPGAAWLLGSGLLGLISIRRRKK